MEHEDPRQVHLMSGLLDHQSPCFQRASEIHGRECRSDVVGQERGSTEGEGGKKAAYGHHRIPRVVEGQEQVSPGGEDADQFGEGSLEFRRLPEMVECGDGNDAVDGTAGVRKKAYVGDFCGDSGVPLQGLGDHARGDVDSQQLFRGFAKERGQTLALCLVEEIGLERASEGLRSCSLAQPGPLEFIAVRPPDRNPVTAGALPGDPVPVSRDGDFYLHLRRVRSPGLVAGRVWQDHALAIRHVAEGQPLQGARPKSWRQKASAKTMARQHRIQSMARRVGRVLRTQGLRGVWIKLLDVTLHRRLLVLECPVDDARSFQPAGQLRPVIHGFLIRAGVADHVAFRLSEEDDHHPIGTFSPKSYREHVERRLDAGSVCLTALIEGRTVACVWANVGGGSVDYLRCSVRLDPEAVYLHDLYTRPLQRGLGLAPGLIGGIAEHFQAAGCRRLVAVVLPENAASLRILGRVGFRRVGVAGYWGFGSFRWLFCTAAGCSLVSVR